MNSLIKYGLYFVVAFSVLVFGAAEDGKGQRTEDRGRKAEDGGQRTEDRGQRTEDRGQMTDDRGLRTDVRRTRARDRGRRSEDRWRMSGRARDRGWEGTDVRSQPSTQSYAVPRRSESPRLNTSCTIYRSYRAGLKGPVQLGKEVRGQRSGMIAPVKYASLSFGI